MRLVFFALALCGWALVFGVNAQSLDDKIDALAEQLIADSPSYQEQVFKNLSETTKGMVRLIDKNRVRIQLYRMAVNELKPEPSLTQEQLRWLVEIEDAFVESDRTYAAARLNYVLSHKSAYVQETEHSADLRADWRNAGLGKLGEASRKEEKAKRDLATLRMRVELQKKKE